MIVNRYKKSNNKIQKGKRFIEKIIGADYYRKVANYRSIKAYRKKIKLGTSLMPDFPCSIEIETVNRCNGECSFCPVNRNVDTRIYKKMDEELFIKIIKELNEKNYSGSVALFSNNEPFIDKDIVNKTRQLRKAVPNAFVYLFSNGSLITEQKFREIIPYLDLFIIDNYNDKLELNDNLIPINEICENDEALNKKVEIHIRKKTEVLSSRGGQAPNVDNLKKRNYSCLLPFQDFVIRPDGKVSLCCNDALGKMTLGDVNTDSITNIWNGALYKEVREKCLNDISVIDLCRFCDSKHDLSRIGM